MLVTTRAQTEGEDSDVSAICTCLLNDCIPIIDISICEQEDSLLFARLALCLSVLQRFQDLSPAEIVIEKINLFDRCILVLIVVIEYVTFIKMLERRAEANDGELASLGETAHEKHAGLSGNLHSIVQAHAAASVDDKDEMEV